MSSLTEEEFYITVQYLVETGALSLPYGFMPGATLGGMQGLLTEAAWNAYRWNPPHFLAYPDPDPLASPKPAWSRLLAQVEPARVARGRPAARDALRQECARRIARAYGETNFLDEVKLRLRQGHTTAQDTERERLRATYHTLKAALATMTAQQLQAFDPTADAVWQKRG